MPSKDLTVIGSSSGAMGVVIAVVLREFDLSCLFRDFDQDE